MKTSNVGHIVEAFYSIQGEGPNVGKPSFFIRFAGCNLRCRYCDSKLASRSPDWPRKPEDLAVPGIIDQLPEIVRQIPAVCQRVIFTGGEPLLQPLATIADEIRRISGRRLLFEVETNGTIFPSTEVRDVVSFWCVSPKLQGSQDEDESIPVGFSTENVGRWANAFGWSMTGVFKFVVGSRDEFCEVKDLVQSLEINPSRVYIMREGVERESFLGSPFNLELIEWCKSEGYSYSTRLHVVLWNKTVGV